MFAYLFEKFQDFFPAGAYIIRQGAVGDNFFLISQGNVKVTQRLPGKYFSVSASMILVNLTSTSLQAEQLRKKFERLVAVIILEKCL